MFKHGNHKHSKVSEARTCEKAKKVGLIVKPAEEKKPVPLHETPCRCSPYDRCWGVRVEDAKGANTSWEAIRRLHRAYND